MNATGDDFTLSPIQSAVVCSLLKDLERRILLIKAAAIKKYGLENEAISSSLITTSASFLEFTDTVESETSGSEVDLADSSEIKERDTQIVQHEESSTNCSDPEVIKMKKELEKIDFRKRKDRNITEPSLDLRQATNNKKFIQSVDYILNIIGRTKLDLEKTNNFSVLKQEVDKTFEILNRDSKVKEDIVKLEKRIVQLKEEMANIKVEMSATEQFITCEMTRLKDEHFELNREGEETRQVAELYFNANKSNMETQHHHELNAEKEKIQKIEKQIDRDMHCLAVMDAWTEDFCEKIEGKIDEWKLKLRRDEMVMEMRIEGKKRAIKAQQELIQTLNETIAERLEELAPWEEEKEVERQQRLAHMRRYYSCRKIQRWWRSHMVKLKLYRKRKLKPKV